MLEKILKDIIKDLKNGSKDSDRIIEYTNYNSKYVVLRPRATVTIELTSGIIAKIDVTDLLMEERND